MENKKILSELTDIFRKELGTDNLVLSEDLTSKDVDKWDSLTHLILISEIENRFNIKFKLKEIDKMLNVGDLISSVQSKTLNN